MVALVACAAWLHSSPLILDEVWRSSAEVFDISRDGKDMIVATDGGLFCAQGSTWTWRQSPPALRSILSLHPLAVSTASGRTLLEEGNTWRVGHVAVATRDRSLDTGILLDAGTDWPLRQQPPPAHPYSLLQHGGSTYVGTNKGLFVWGSADTAWKPVVLPGKLPLPRPNGIAESGAAMVVGGMGGLFVGQPGTWQQVCSDPIRQVEQVGSSVWVLHGNGALDRVDAQQNRLWPDVLFGASRRPWTSALGSVGAELGLGGFGGFAARGVEPFEKYPAELLGDVVQCIAGEQGSIWVGSEKSGLFRFEGDQMSRWNPGNGLSDPNVTAVLPMRGGTVKVGTLHSGLFTVDRGAIKRAQSPTTRVSSLALWHGKVIMGGLDGAWIKEGAEWRELPTNGEETTAISVIGEKLAVVTAASIYWFKEASPVHAAT